MSWAALAVPPYQRARYREQWLADLRDAGEVGVPRRQIVVGAFAFAGGSLTRSLLQRELRASFSWVQVGVLVALAGIIFYVLIPDGALTGKTAFRDRFDVFAGFMNTPFVLLAPVLIVLLTGTRFARELAHRFASSTRVRVRVESYVLAKLLVGCGTAFVVFFAWTLLAYVIANLGWPLLGDPSVDPRGYDLTTASAVVDSWHRSTLSQWLQAGTWVYGFGYSAWVGFCAAVYAGLGLAMLLVLRQRVIAMAVPFVLYFGQTVAAQLLGGGQWSLQQSMFPFGMVQAPVLVGMAPTLLLAAVVLVLWAVLLRRLVRLENLA